MIDNLSGFLNELKTYVVCESGYLTIEEIIETMVKKKMISLSGYDISQVNCPLILNDIQEHMQRYTDAEVMAYFLKYMFDFKNDNIYKQKLYSVGIINCANVDIRRVERIHLNLRRRIFAQPKYTKETFVFISDIIGNDKFREAVKESQTAPMTVKEFVHYHFKCSLLNHDGTLEKINKIKDVITEIKPFVKFINTDEFPWNLLVTLNRDYHINVYQKLADFLSANGLTLDDIIEKQDIATDVFKYNLCAFVHIKSRVDVIAAKFIHNLTLSDIKISKLSDSSINVSITRIKQIYDAAMRAMVDAITDNSRFFFDGFELFAKKLNPDEVANRIMCDKLPPNIMDMLIAVIPTAPYMTLEELTSIIYNNPLIHHVIVYGFLKGVVVANQELRVSQGISRTPVIPEDVVDLNLSQRATNALIRSGIHKTIDLITLSYDDLHNIRNIGQKSFDEIIETLKIYGVHITDKEDTSHESTFNYTHTGS